MRLLISHSWEFIVPMPSNLNIESSFYVLGNYLKSKKELESIKSPKPEVSDEGKVDQSVEDVEGVGK